MLLLLALNLGHIITFGWPLGFPLPPTGARYFPFFGAIALVCNAFIFIVAAALAARTHARRAVRAPN